MRILGFTVPLFLLLIVAFVLGGKFPGVVAKIPLVNRI